MHPGRLQTSSSDEHPALNPDGLKKAEGKGRFGSMMQIIRNKYNREAMEASKVDHRDEDKHQAEMICFLYKSYGTWFHQLVHTPRVLDPIVSPCDQESHL